MIAKMLRLTDANAFWNFINDVFWILAPPSQSPVAVGTSRPKQTVQLCFPTRSEAPRRSLARSRSHKRQRGIK